MGPQLQQRRFYFEQVVVQRPNAALVELNHITVAMMVPLSLVATCLPTNPTMWIRQHTLPYCDAEQIDTFQSQSLRTVSLDKCALIFLSQLEL